MKTFTPDLDPAVLARLRAYAAHFAPDFQQSKPARWAGVYLHGLLADGERKSIEPLSRRVALPPDLTSADPEQALQQFVNQSPWDDQKVLTRYRALLAEPHSHAPRGHFRAAVHSAGRGRLDFETSTRASGLDRPLSAVAFPCDMSICT